MTHAERLEYTLEPAPQLELVETVPTQRFHGTAQVEGSPEVVKWTVEVPEEGLVYDGLTLLIPGYGCIKRHSRGERHANALSGEATISYDPGRRSGSLIDDLRKPQDYHTEVASSVLSSVQERFAEDISIPFRGQIDTHKVTLSEHSMGGFSGTELALRRPSEIDVKIGKATVGFGSPHWTSPWEIDALYTAREILGYISSGEVNISILQMWRSLNYFGKNVARSGGEAFACLTKKNVEDVVRVSDMGIPTAYLAFDLDGLVPFKPIENTVRKAVDKTEVLEGYGHLAPQRYPADVAAAVRGLRKRLRG